MTAYYNEIDKYAAQWLRNLIAENLIAPGDVDERSIADVRPSDVAGYRQCHWFAGIGGWSLAARLAGWPDSRELWTGSCPCQPFSVAGKQGGFDDKRHLWPEFFRIIDDRKPNIVMGEQVAAAVGAHWLDGVLDDLENIGYAGRAVVVPACAVNAPHRRDRVWFIAESAKIRRDRAMDHRQRTRLEGLAGDDSAAEGWAQSNRSITAAGSGHWGDAGWIIGHDGKARRVGTRIRGVDDGLSASLVELRAGQDAEEIEMIPLLAHGVVARVGKLRAFGNAIVPQVAAEIIAAYMDCAPPLETECAA